MEDISVFFFVENLLLSNFKYLNCIQPWNIFEVLITSSVSNCDISKLVKETQPVNILCISTVFLVLKFWTFNERKLEHPENK